MIMRRMGVYIVFCVFLKCDAWWQKVKEKEYDSRLTTTTLEKRQILGVDLLKRNRENVNVRKACLDASRIITMPMMSCKCSECSCRFQRIILQQLMLMQMLGITKAEEVCNGVVSDKYGDPVNEQIVLKTDKFSVYAVSDSVLNRAKAAAFRD